MMPDGRTTIQKEQQKRAASLATDNPHFGREASGLELHLSDRITCSRAIVIPNTEGAIEWNAKKQPQSQMFCILFAAWGMVHQPLGAQDA
jgi:hypothetical protein